ncbi:MAG: acyl-CoA dehydrogenase family protein [Pirellulales bacterium]
MKPSDREKQMAEAEALFGDRLKNVSFAGGLYYGMHLSEKLAAYPAEHDEATDGLVDELKRFCREEINPAAIDRDANIPERVIGGLGKLGVLGACLPRSCGGRGLTQTQYCRLIEVLGGHCGSTALFVNAHHSIGPRSIVLFGTPEQQATWLPKLATGEWISAFALTEPAAGSDAANVQTTATPTGDGRGYILNGEKRYITNGSIARALTVMARTPVSGDSVSGNSVANSSETRVTAFLATPDMPGFEITEERMPKMGVRGTVTSRLAFRDMFVPKENVLGEVGKGLKVALTVLDYGRTTFGASCTGAAKYCLQRSRSYANERVQFGEKIGEFELVKQKLAYMAAGVYAMESATYQTAALIDSGASEYMLETAMLKVFSTEVLWRILDDTFQIHGGMAYFSDEPFERMIRDARINTVGEGSNDVLRPFIALVGLRSVGLELQEMQQAISKPLSNLARLGNFAARQLGSLVSSPDVAVRATQLEADAARLASDIAHFGHQMTRLLAAHREEILDRQFHLARVANAATELYVSRCVLARLDHLLNNDHADAAQRSDDLATARYYLTTAHRRIRSRLKELWDNDDDETTALADRILDGR